MQYVTHLTRINIPIITIGTDTKMIETYIKTPTNSDQISDNILLILSLFYPSYLKNQLYYRSKPYQLRIFYG